MIIERYERPVDFNAPTLSSPIHQELDWILDDSKLFALFCHDFKQHYKTSRAGCRPSPAEVTYRMTCLRRRQQWPYRQAEEVRDSPGYRAWVRVYDNPVPDYSTLNDLERLIRPQTLHHMNDRVIQLAEAYRITQGYRLRVDSSVTETNIHHPTDSTLLVDGVRVLSRNLERAEPYLPAQLCAQGVCADHPRSARRRARQIAQLSRPGDKRVKQSPTADSKKSPKTCLSRVDQNCADEFGASAAGVSGLGTSHGQQAQRLFQQLGEWMLLVEHAIDQTERRNLQDQTLAADDKILSLFEPHTQIIRRDKTPPHETEFGHKVNFAEVEHGLMSDWQVVRLGNPPDEQMVPALLQHHRRRKFARVEHVMRWGTRDTLKSKLQDLG